MRLSNTSTDDVREAWLASGGDPMDFDIWLERELDSAVSKATRFDRYDDFD